MSSIYRIAAALLGTLALSACAVGPPPGPTIAALPGKDKSLEVFQQDDAACREYAAQTLGGVSPATAANQSMANSSIAGTLLGAAAGAAIGAAAGNPAAGAAIGAASGLALGASSGAGAANYSAASVQQGYDVSYAQCMTSRGDQIASSPAPGPYGGGAYPGGPYGPYPYPPPAYAYAPYPAYYPYPYYGPAVSVGFGWGGGWGWGHHCWRHGC